MTPPDLATSSVLAGAVMIWASAVLSSGAADLDSCGSSRPNASTASSVRLAEYLNLDSHPRHDTRLRGALPPCPGRRCRPPRPQTTWL